MKNTMKKMQYSTLSNYQINSDCFSNSNFQSHKLCIYYIGHIQYTHIDGEKKIFLQALQTERTSLAYLASEHWLMSTENLGKLCYPVMSKTSNNRLKRAEKASF